MNIKHKGMSRVRFLNGRITVVQSQLSYLDVSCPVHVNLFLTDDLFVLFYFHFLRNSAYRFDRLLKNFFAVRHKDLPILFVKVRRKTQFCQNVEAHQWCMRQILGIRFKDLFS